MGKHYPQACGIIIQAVQYGHGYALDLQKFYKIKNKIWLLLKTIYYNISVMKQIEVADID